MEKIAHQDRHSYRERWWSSLAASQWQNLKTTIVGRARRLVRLGLEIVLTRIPGPAATERVCPFRTQNALPNESRTIPFRLDRLR